MKTTITIKYEELSYEKQCQLVDQVKKMLKGGYETEGKTFMARSWHDPKPKNYKEAVVRIYAYEYRVWQAYEQTGGERPDFDEMYSDFLEQQVREQLSAALQRNEVEVEV